MKSTYDRIQAEKTKNPGEPVVKIAKRLKLSPAYYYKYRRQNGETKSTVKYRKIKSLAPTPISGQLMVVMGSPEQVKEFLGGAQ